MTIKPHLYIVRGLPGAGKTTFVGNYLSDARHFESDQFFTKNDVYKFEGKLIEAAHDWCYSQVVYHLDRGYDVAVSNTFTMMWELEKYLDIPRIVDCSISVVEIRTQFKSVHGIPDEKFEIMKNRWEVIPQQWIDDGLFVRVIDK